MQSLHSLNWDNSYTTGVITYFPYYLDVNVKLTYCLIPNPILQQVFKIKILQQHTDTILDIIASNKKCLFRYVMHLTSDKKDSHEQHWCLTDYEIASKELIWW